MKKNFEPGLVDVLNAFGRNLLLSINKIHVATIRSFNANRQTVRASIAYKKLMRVKEGDKYVDRMKDYPLLVDCPVVILGGGSANLTFPISPGDEALILFCDRDIDNWFSGGKVGPPRTIRLHSFSDGFALVGVRSLQRVITEYDVERAKLAKGSTVVAVGDDKVLIRNAQRTLAEAIDGLALAIRALEVNVAVDPNTGIGNGFLTTGSAFAIDDEVTKIKELLE